LIARPIHAFNPGPMTGEGNCTWLLPGRIPTLIDAGTGDARHVSAVAEALAGHDLLQVLVTHGHPDHASGAPVLAKRWPGARFRKMPWPERDARVDVAWESLVDGEHVEAGDSTIVALHTPGHAPDHLCFWHEQTRTVFTGDLVVKGTTVYIPGNEHGDVAAYVDSLERVLALDPARMYPAHGPVIDEAAPVLRAYIEHRREREAQVLDALRRGDTSAEAITARIYRSLNTQLMPLACESVTAHLRKLQREGRARPDGGVWHIIES
jgi:glyoxylase-like metal-dependent hydrolase (beta-lactamase superfamily II)